MPTASTRAGHPLPMLKACFDCVTRSSFARPSGTTAAADTGPSRNVSAQSFHRVHWWATTGRGSRTDVSARVAPIGPSGRPRRSVTIFAGGWEFRLAPGWEERARPNLRPHLAPRGLDFSSPGPLVFCRPREYSAQRINSCSARPSESCSAQRADLTTPIHSIELHD